jgi:hypothetical protein
MLQIFCVGANLKALLQGPKCPDVLKATVPILERKWGQDQRTGTIGEVNNLGDAKTRSMGAAKRVSFLTDEYDAAFKAGFENISKVLKNDPKGGLRGAMAHKRVTIGGRIFAKGNENLSEAEVFFEPLCSNNLIPGTIVGIFSVQDGEDEVFVLSIYPRKPVPSGTANPFTRYPDFGAELWSTELEDRMVCIPTTQPIYHSQRRQWAKGILVLKPIKPVSLRTILTMMT